MNTWDCIVVGTGGVGSAALYHLARRGARVLGLDHPGLRATHQEASVLGGAYRVVRAEKDQHQ